MSTPSADAIKDYPYEFAVVPLKHMFTDKYQRKLTTFADTIAKKWNPALVGTVVLSKRSATKYALIDGQTRAAGAKENAVKALPALVYEGLSLQQEAELFALFQTQRRGMHSADRFKAEVIAGHEPAVTIDRIVREAGYVVGNNHSEQHGAVITAPAALEYVYRGAVDARAKSKPSAELLERTLRIITEAWPDRPETARNAIIIRGVGLFLSKAGRIDEERLAQRLGKVKPSEIAKRAQALREGRGISGTNPRETAEAIESQYARR